MDQPATSALYSARPTIEVDGDVETLLSEGLASLLVEERTDGLSRCELTFGNWGTVGREPGFLFFDRELLDFGKEITIKGGNRDTEATLFAGKVTGLEAQYPQTRPPELTVLAEDRLQDLRMTRRTRTFDDQTDADVFRAIARAHGLQPEVDVEEVEHRMLAQVNQSDLGYVRDRARALDARVHVDGGKFIVKSRSRDDGDELELTYGQEVRELSILADLAAQRTSVTVSGWDVDNKEAATYKADSSAIAAELGSDRGGSDLLDEAFGERAEVIAHGVPWNQAEARTTAESRYRAIARRFVTGRVLTEGDGRIKVGTRVRLKALGAMFEGTYEVTAVRHTFDAASGFRTRFEVERPGIGGSA